ncbi:MAG TPA: glycogen debranching N-terminal domain-containing protein, partial [Acidimicrobiales bacterium]
MPGATRMAPVDVPVGPPVISIFTDDEVLVSDPAGRLSGTEEQGYFVADTRLVSGYRLRLGGVAPVLVNSSEVEHYSARFEFVNGRFPTMAETVEEGQVHLRLDRTVGGGVHEDYWVVNHSRFPLRFDLRVSMESDFADIFDVKQGTLIHRGRTQETWDESNCTRTTTYENRGFARALRVVTKGAETPPEYANGWFRFGIVLWPGESWQTCIFWLPSLDGRTHRFPVRACHDLMGESERDRARLAWAASSTRFTTDNSEVTAIAARAISDLAGLRLASRDGTNPEGMGWVPAAGVPWFLSLFGRDSLTVSLQTLALSLDITTGTLKALGDGQADGYDDARDMQPGKILHEVRHGELAQLGLVPHTPYYGTHEATVLYVWTAAQAWRWHGQRSQLDRVRPHVERCLAWIERDGDPDGDGLQEYATRAAEGGYYNQGWKDSGDAIVTSTGDLAGLPIALCEHQAYVIAAKRAWATVLADAYGDAAGARRLRAEASDLAGLLEERFWWEEEGTYYLGLDGDKRPIESVTSNPGHLLWAHAVEPDRAVSVVRRLLQDDMWSGWGIRTLSSRHPAYNPFSYQLGSVWPHDNAVCVDGFRQYGAD